MAIDTTVGGVAANSYGSLNDANAYFLNRLDTEDWDAAEQEEQERALIQATLLLDELDYVGEIATSTQALKWPRIDDDIFDIGWLITEIPPKLKLAQFELALSLLGSGSSNTGSSSQPVSSLKIGSSVEVKYDTSLAFVDTAIDSVGLVIQVARFLKGLRIPTVIA